MALLATVSFIASSHHRRNQRWPFSGHHDTVVMTLGWYIAPVMIANLLEYVIIDKKFNENLSKRTALAALMHTNPQVEWELLETS